MTAMVCAKLAKELLARLIADRDALPLPPFA
jgi:hypothetical protein